MQRCHSNSTIALTDMCTEQDLTYVSNVNGTYSTIDHFIISNSLSTCVKNYCTVNDIDNISDHLHLCMYIHLPVNIMYFNDTRYFVPKSKWSSANELMLSEYRHKTRFVITKY